MFSPQALEDLKNLEVLSIVFNKYNCKYLFGMNKPMHEKSLIRLVNKDLKNTCDLNSIASI
jgi:hypothetical protein|tara:strand:+ start:687 stop:869 length:183 start_codon:yes stop_codon:yes gene_type:complete